MDYRIICDSCTDFDNNMKNNKHFSLVPLSLQIGDYQVLDDLCFNQKDFLDKMANSKVGAKTACPSPELFFKEFEKEATNIFVLTLSEHLSGTYQSAVIAKGMYEEEYGQAKNIFVLSSNSASAGQYRLALELNKLCESGLSFSDICDKITKLRDEMKTYFVLENLDTLRKNGRLTGLSAFFATTLNIKPIMGSVDGKIIKLDQARGISKALLKMVDIASKECKSFAKDKIVAITHVNNPDRAKLVAEAFKKTGEFKDVLITSAMGVSTVYAGDGGIVLGIG